MRRMISFLILLFVAIPTMAVAQTDPVELYKQALTLQDSGAYAEALDRFEQSGQEGAPQEWILYHRAFCFGVMGSSDEAIRLLSELRTDYPTGPFATRALEFQAALLSALERHSEASTIFLLLSDEDPAGNGQWIYRAAEELEAVEEWTEAYRLYFSVLDGYPRSGFAHRASLRINDLRRDHSDLLPEISDYERFLVGRVSCEQKDYITALDQFGSMEHQTVDSRLRDDILYYHGLALLRTSEYEEALRRFRQLRRNFPHTIYYNDSIDRTVECYLYLGNGEIALSYFSQVAEEGTSSSLATLWGLAQYEELIGEWENALFIYAHLAGRVNDDFERAAQAMLQICRIYEEEKKEDPWVMNLSRMKIRFYGTEALQEALFERACFLEETGRLEEALRVYAELLGMTPPGYFHNRACERCRFLGQLRYHPDEAQANIEEAVEAWAEGRTRESLEQARSLWYAYPEMPTTDEARDLALEIEKRSFELLWIRQGVSFDTTAEGNRRWLMQPPWNEIDWRVEARLDAAAFLAAAGSYSELMDELTYAARRQDLRALDRLSLEAARLSGREEEAIGLAEKLLYDPLLPWDWVAVDTGIQAGCYPLVYWKIIETVADSYGLDPLFLTAVIREESGFNPVKISEDLQRIGLMQLDPPSAQWLADRARMEGYSIEQLFSPDTNVMLGAYYLHQLLVKYEGDKIFALAAYHGGEGNVDSWRAAFPDLEGDDFIRIIPFPETRSYIRNTLASFWYYQDRYSQKD